MSFNFLPEDYQAPKTSNFYLKLQEGENKVRILSQPILGWEDWNAKKPVRYRFNQKPLKSFDATKPVRHFWSFIVWNYNEEQIQVFHVTQATLRKAIEALCKDSDWGAPFFYDIKIMKTGEGTDTEYMVNPLPHKPVHDYIIEQFNNRRCNLEAIFANADPFSPEWREYTPGIFSKDSSPTLNVAQPVSTTESLVSKEEALELQNILNECDPAFKEQIETTLRNSPKAITSYEQMPLAVFMRLKVVAIQKRKDYQAALEADLFPF